MLTRTVDRIIQTYDILYNKIFVLNDEGNKSELMCTYNIDSSKDVEILPDTISLHRKKQTNTLYTINALNECIKNSNNGVLDTTFQLNWDNYRNSILVTNEDGMRRIDTSIKEVVHIKIKR
tara:strand:+ start:462 stop:824 length:363 start_codon:yes stop_codon:yes gene_type:complete